MRSEIWKKVWEATLWTLKSEKEKKEVHQTPEQRFLFSSWRCPHQSRYPHCSLWRSRWTFSEGTDTFGELTLEQVVLTETAACGDEQICHCSQWRLPHQSRYLDCSPWRTHAETNLFWRNVWHVGDPQWSQKNVGRRKEPWKGTFRCWLLLLVSHPLPVPLVARI